MAHFEPATSYRARPSYLPLLRIESVWRPTLGWAAGVCALAVAVIVRLGGKSEFLYWQF
jgi:hypothetical protein